MPPSTPVDVFTDWLSTRPREARMAIAIDADRLVCESGLLGRNTIVDKKGREWQVVVFQGDDLAFRLRFRKAAAHPATVIVLTRGEGTDEKIDVSCITDVLARNEGGDPLDLSVSAFFKRLCPKINFPPLELRRHKDALLTRLEAVPTAAAKIVERWGRPADWGRGHVAAMSLLARHRVLSVRDLWPDETEPVDFVAHALRLLIGDPQLADERVLVQEIIREAARPQVSQHLHWLDVPPEELAAYLILRRFVADVELQNPSNQLSGLQIFSPETSLLELEPLALGVAAALSADPQVWAAVNTLAETFLTPRRLQKVMSLLPTVDQQPASFAAAARRHGMAPVLLKQHLRTVLLSFFARPTEVSLAWVPQLVDHPAMVEPVDALSPRALECRATLQVLRALQSVEERLNLSPPLFPHADALLDWYAESGHYRLEMDLSQAFHDLETCGDDEIASAGMRYLFGGVDDLVPSPTSLKGRVRARLDTLDCSLAAFVRANPAAFARGPRSALRLVKEHLGHVVEQINTGATSGRVWVLLFDGMRFDTWETIVQPILAEHFAIEGQPCFCVLPSYTQVARTSLFAGGLPSEWRGYTGRPTKNETTLIARNLGLTQQEVKTRLRFVTEADTSRARMMMGFADTDAQNVNVLIYPISDECHEFRGELTAFNNKILSEHYTESAKKELIKSRIKENGEYTLLGQLTVRLDQARDHYWADVPALGDNTVRVGPKILEQYREALMTSGAWGTMVIEYDATYEIKSRKYPFYVREFTPLQYTRLDLDDYIAKRPLFTEDEWLDLLVQSIGFNPARFDRRVKMLMLLRLVPFVEANYNLIELGPRETGKTYTFRNTSNRSFVVSGGKATPATLFYNKATRKLGVIGLKQVVFFDEIASTRFDDAEASVSVLKDYMQTGKFSRGDQEFSAQCSVVLGGNIDTDVEQRRPEVYYRHLFEVLPIELQDAAFLDRIHAYLPGWEMPKIRPENYATGYGFLTDYMAEIFSELRRRNFQTHVAAWVDLSGMTGRNQDAIKKTVAGLLKLQYPHRSPETLMREEIGPLVEVAVEMRKRVTDQLAKMLPAEFGAIDYSYTLAQQ